MKLNKIVYTYSLFFLLVLVTVGVTVAAFIDKGKVLGSTFSVGSSDLKFLLNLGAGTENTNLSDELQGPSFSNISSNWKQDYLVKIYNNGSTDIQLTSNSNYLTVNDPDDLRNIIYVEPFEWNDTNNNGLLDEGEKGAGFGRKTIVKWKTEGFSFGTILQGNVKSLVLSFSTDTVSDTKQGKSGIFDFEFDSISQ